MLGISDLGYKWGLYGDELWPTLRSGVCTNSLGSHGSDGVLRMVRVDVPGTDGGDMVLDVDEDVRSRLVEEYERLVRATDVVLIEGSSPDVSDDGSDGSGGAETCIVDLESLVALKVALANEKAVRAAYLQEQRLRAYRDELDRACNERVAMLMLGSTRGVIAMLVLRGNLRDRIELLGVEKEVFERSDVQRDLQRIAEEQWAGHVRLLRPGAKGREARPDIGNGALLYLTAEHMENFSNFLWKNHIIAQSKHVFVSLLFRGVVAGALDRPPFGSVRNNFLMSRAGTVVSEVWFDVSAIS